MLSVIIRVCVQLQEARKAPAWCDKRPPERHAPGARRVVDGARAAPRRGGGARLYDRVRGSRLYNRVRGSRLGKRDSNLAKRGAHLAKRSSHHCYSQTKAKFCFQTLVVKVLLNLLWI